MRRETGQVTGEALLIALGVALTILVGQEIVKGATWVGHEAKKAGHALVHVLKNVPHP